MRRGVHHHREGGYLSAQRGTNLGREATSLRRGSSLHLREASYLSAQRPLPLPKEASYLCAEASSSLLRLFLVYMPPWCIYASLLVYSGVWENRA